MNDLHRYSLDHFQGLLNLFVNNRFALKNSQESNMSLVNRAESLENSFGQIIHQLQDIKASFKSTFRKDPLFHTGCLCQHTQASFREAHVSALPFGLAGMRSVSLSL